jgi:hypothetical protein
MQMAEFGDNSPRTYGAAGLESPSLNKEGFDVAQVSLARNCAAILCLTRCMVSLPLTG